MKKELAAIALCGVMLMSGPLALAQDHHDDHRDAPPAHYHGMYDQGRHEGWYKRGGHIPPQYRGSSYVVTDYQRYRLKPPPRGYHYVRSDNGDFLLAAITTGAILSIVAASH